MHYCSYHPLQPASYQCEACYRQQCDSCVDEGQHCFLCGRATEGLGAEHRVEPFWRRLQGSFRYPLNRQSLPLIIGVAVVTAVLAYLPSLAIFTWVISLIATGVIMKYSFRCLEDTARGRMVPPELTEAYQGGVGLVFQLLLMVIVLVAMVVGVGYLFGQRLAGLVGFFFMLGLPAMLISFALSQNLFAAVNPLNTFRLMARIGLPYGLLLGLIMVMVGSVSVVHQFIGTHFSVLSTILQSAASNYYLIVAFHIMGYMIFQYQDKLGFTAQEDYGDDNAIRSDEDSQAARIGVFLKEGRYDRVFELFDQATRRNPDSKRFHSQYFELLYQLKERERMADFATRYLSYSQRQGHTERLYDIYLQVREVAPEYIPADPDIRLLLAKSAMQRGDAKATIRLINAMHRQHPGYARLKDAFELMAEALEQMPNRLKEAQQCRQLVSKLSKRA